MRTAIGVMARAPSSPGKTRLAAHLLEPDLLALREALLADALATVCAVPRADTIVFITPDFGPDEVRPSGFWGQTGVGPVSDPCQTGVRPGSDTGLTPTPRPFAIVPQGDGDLGARMRRALSHLLEERGYAAAMLVGTDAPLMTVENLAEAAQLLHERSGIVLGPADDGGYYLIGMTQVHAALFDGIAWGGSTVLRETLAVAARAAIDATLIRGTYDVDTIDDLRRLERDLAMQPPEIAAHVRNALASFSSRRHEVHEELEVPVVQKEKS